MTCDPAHIFIGMPKPFFDKFANVKCMLADNVEGPFPAEIQDSALRYVSLVDAFPMTATGKIQKLKMRETMIEELKLMEERYA